MLVSAECVVLSEIVLLSVTDNRSCVDVTSEDIVFVRLEVVLNLSPLSFNGSLGSICSVTVFTLNFDCFSSAFSLTFVSLPLLGNFISSFVLFLMGISVIVSSVVRDSVLVMFAL